VIWFLIASIDKLQDEVAITIESLRMAGI
jgi:phospholipid-translocating ATPase